MPHTPEEFNDYVAKELRAGDKRMDEIVKTVAAIQIEQASAKVLLAENTETINEIKTDTAPMLFLPLKCQHSYHTYLTKRNSAQLPEE